MNRDPLCPGLASLDNLAQATNRHRNRLDTISLENLENLLVNNIAEEFFQAKILVDQYYHIVSATDAQLELFDKVKTCYIHDTFKLSEALFVQVMSIHEFLKSEGNTKQVPLAFVHIFR